MFLSHRYLRESEWLHQNILLSNILFYIPTVLSLCLVYFNIYAYLSKVEPVRRFGRPLTVFCIVVALFCLLCSITPPILGYLSLRNIETDYTIPNTSESLKIETPDPDRRSLSKHEARLYYRKTNKLVEYVDEYGNKVLYSPDKLDQLYVRNRQDLEFLKERVTYIRKSVIILLAITVLSFFGFLLFLGYMKKIGKIGRKNGIELAHP
jgi:hypothetical protein